MKTVEEVLAELKKLDSDLADESDYLKDCLKIDLFVEVPDDIFNEALRQSGIKERDFWLIVNSRHHDRKLRMRHRTIVHIPHASLNAPRCFYDRLKVDRNYFHRMNIYESDYLIDQFRPDDLDCLIFPYSRMFCDVERLRDDGKELNALLNKRGVIYERDANKMAFINIDQEYKNKVLCEYYDEHHKKLCDLVENKIKAYGRCLIVDLHSYSDGYVKKTALIYRGSNPDICIGINNYDQMKGMIEMIQRLCNRYGYTNSLNYPYQGSIVPMEYMNNERVESVRLEINKRIYLNEDMDELDQKKADRLRSFMKEFYKDL